MLTREHNSASRLLNPTLVNLPPPESLKPTPRRYLSAPVYQLYNIACEMVGESLLL